VSVKDRDTRFDVAGEPKAIPWTHVTPIRAATDAFAQIDVRRGDVMAWPTNLVSLSDRLLKISKASAHSPGGNAAVAL
jgi:hypothetical protein